MGWVKHVSSTVLLGDSGNHEILVTVQTDTCLAWPTRPSVSQLTNDKKDVPMKKQEKIEAIKPLVVEFCAAGWKAKHYGDEAGGKLQPLVTMFIDMGFNPDHLKSPYTNKQTGVLAEGIGANCAHVKTFNTFHAICHESQPDDALKLYKTAMLFGGKRGKDGWQASTPAELIQPTKNAQGFGNSMLAKIRNGVIAEEKKEAAIKAGKPTNGKKSELDRLIEGLVTAANRLEAKNADKLPAGFNDARLSLKGEITEMLKELSIWHEKQA